jgi:hypothetical protein
MALTQVQASIWTSKLLLALQKNLVFGQDAVVNKAYQPEIASGGKEAHIHGLADVSVVNYTKYTPLTPEQLTDSRQTLLIDQQKAFSFFIDDVDQVQSTPQVVNSIMDQAGYELVEEADRYISGLYSSAGVGTVGAVVAADTTNVYTRLLAASRQLTINNVPREDRFAIVSPQYEEMLLQNPTYLAAATESPLNGAVGRLAGFDILVSNNVTKTAAGPFNHHCVVGHPIAWTFASQIQKIESVREPRMFVDTIKGLYTYGAKVIRPEALLDMNITFTT